MMKKIKLLCIPLLLLVTLLQAQNPGYEVTNLRQLNSDHLDYSAVKYKNGVVFTSTRGNGSIFSCENSLTGGHYSDLYFAPSNGEGSYGEPVLLEGDLNGKYHDGVATFSYDWNTMYFSRNNGKGPNDKGNVDLKIYKATLKKGTWKNVEELPFNGEDFETCHPALSADGNMLFFTSNRPGGYGGMDIYCVKLSNGTWGTPVNLGAEINSAGNEIFPFIDASGVLYFSSDGHLGLGGLDVFSVNERNGLWENRTNLGTPVNSPSDDFGFTGNTNSTAGFLTSNRPGGKGQDDLYQWKFNGQRPVMANICVVDKNTERRVEDALLSMAPVAGVNTNAGSLTVANKNLNFLQLQSMDINGQNYLVFVPYDQRMMASNVSTTTGGKSCNITLPVLPGNMYRINVEKPGYQPLAMSVPASEVLKGKEYLVPIEPVEKTLAFQGSVKNQQNGRPLPGATVKVMNKCTGQQMEFAVDHRGEFQMDVTCGCDYEILAMKGDYEVSHEVISTSNLGCESKPYLTADVAMTPKRMPDPSTAPVVEKENFKVGAVIKLDNVYYDYDKYFIRSDAAKELDKVVNLLIKYPSMEIELRSHTDARGSDSYNMQLSQQRAEAAINYIISRGIDPSRLSAKGYGETMLVNECENGVDCSDARHQENRRTEIKITRFDEDDIRIEGN